jgi:HK97 family phage major capsid protein
MDRYTKQLGAVEREMRDVLGKARAITSNAADEGRGINEDEEVVLQGHLKAVEVLKEKRGEIQDAIDTRQRVEDAGKSLLVGDDEESGSKEQVPAHRKAMSVGEAFVKSDGYKALMDKGLNGNWTTGSVEIQGKTLLTEASGGAALVGTNQPDIQPGILPKLFQRLTVAQLMAQGSTTSNLVRYMVESTATNSAGGTAEGATKPESTLAFTATDEPVKKISTFLPVTDEMLEDEAQLQSYINARLSLFVQMEEERELLNGGGTNELVGLVSRIPANNKGMRKAGASVTDIDHIFRAISRVREAFLEPDGIVIHPNDWEGIVLQKDAQNNYIGPGPFSAEAGKTLWGLNVVVTTAVAEAQPIIGAFGSAAQIFRRSGLTVEASNSHSTFFQENKTAIRAEERLALAVFRPEAFAICDLGATGVAT